MRIGIVREIKSGEGRVALLPGACVALCAAGHEVLVEAGAGLASGCGDAAYAGCGAQIVPCELAWKADLVVKVKEPQASEWPRLQAGQLLFCFLHLAAEPALAQALCERGVTAIAFETVSHQGQLPILAPMSAVAGRVAVVQGAALLQHADGAGLLLGGVPGALRGRVVVVGAGQAGGHAAALAAALGAEVIAFDRKPERLEAMHALGPNVTGLFPYPDRLAAELAQADLVIGAVLLPGARAPQVITRAMVAGMRPGSVLADIAVDQGGCAETTRPTTHLAPTYVESGVIHYAVTNIPGAVPRTSSPALSGVLLAYVLHLAGPHWRAVPELRSGLAVEGGRLVGAVTP